VVAINYNGAVELAAVNIAGGSPLDETTLITTTAAAGNSATAYYSTTARSNVAYRVVGYIESTQTTAGTWASTPSTIQGMGGQALTAMSSLGYGQTWQNMTSNRAVSTTYYNTTGKPIALMFSRTLAANGGMSFDIGSVSGIHYMSNTQTNQQSMSTTSIVPANSSYKYNAGGSGSSEIFYELR
jgi:hypothetical protein